MSRTYINRDIQLEELDEIFNQKNPRKASVMKKKLELDANRNIIHAVALTQNGVEQEL